MLVSDKEANYFIAFEITLMQKAMIKPVISQGWRKQFHIGQANSSIMHGQLLNV